MSAGGEYRGIGTRFYRESAGSRILMTRRIPRAQRARRDASLALEGGSMLIMMLLKDPEAGSSALARLVDPWSKLFAHSKAVSATVLFLHLVPLVIAAGTAWSADRATLRAARDPGERTRQLRELAATHRLVVGGLALSFVSGVLLFLSDVDTFLPSPAFWVKLALVALLLVNGFMMTRTEQTMASRPDDNALWSRMRGLAILSGTLWIATTLAGVILATYA